MKNMKRILALLLGLMMLCSVAAAETLTGEAEGFAGPIKATVTVEDGKIVALELVGNDETPGIGADALEPLTEAILEAGTIDGVDAYSGATWTSNGVFAAIRNALGIAEEEAEESVLSATAGAINHGIGVVATPRLGPGKDDKDVPVYSFNVIIAYAVTDAEEKIIDLDVDILEIITPNHDGAEDNFIAGWPGAVYNEDSDGDGAVDGEYAQTEENFVSTLKAFRTKRQLGDLYKMNSGTWTQEMDAYESALRGLNAEEVTAWAEKYLSDVNGRALHGTSSNEQDQAKWDALTDEEKAVMDAISGATMSLNDAHGDILSAILKALANQKPVDAKTDVAGLGLGTVVTPRLGPGKDDQEVPVYSFNVVTAGALYDAEGKIVAIREDILEIITPNHDGAEDNVFIGWPGQSYNNDADGDGVVDGVAEQTEDSFVETIKAYRTKRDLGSLYKMNSGTWTSEMDVFESFFAGKSAAEIRTFFEKQCSDSNGRVIREGTTNEADLAKWNALTDEEKANVDALSGATMSLSDAHGDLLGAIEASFAACKPVSITVEK